MTCLPIAQRELRAASRRQSTYRIRCSTAFLGWASAPLPSCWPSTPRLVALIMPAKPSPSPDSTRDSMNPEPA